MYKMDKGFSFKLFDQRYKTQTKAEIYKTSIHYIRYLFFSNHFFVVVTMLIHTFCYMYILSGENETENVPCENG